MYPSLTQRSWNGLKQGWKSPTGGGELIARQGSMESLGNSGREGGQATPGGLLQGRG